VCSSDLLWSGPRGNLFWVLLGISPGASLAEGVNRAEGTARGVGKADLSPEVHQGRDDSSGFPFPIKVIEPAHEKIRVILGFFEGEAPGKDPANIPIHHRNPLMESKNEDCPRGILPDAWKPSQLVKFVGNAPPVQLDDSPCSFLEVQSPPVIAEPAPEVEKLPLFHTGTAMG